jgi:hypothetical protein
MYESLTSILLLYFKRFRQEMSAISYKLQTHPIIFGSSGKPLSEVVRLVRTEERLEPTPFFNAP